MRCVIQKSGVIAIEESPRISPTEGECVFSVKACGICGSDLPRAFSNGAYHYPIVVGHEFSGIVQESTRPELVGRRACVFPILPCGRCDFCQKEAWASCVGYDYYGSRRDGGMQSELLIKESNLIFLPDSVSYEAAAMVEPLAVCLHAAKRAQIDPSSSVLVYGAGTIGLLLAMWAKGLGAKQVFVSDISKERCDFARSLGFEIYSGERVDRVFEASGAPAAVEDAVLRCEAFGKIVLIGHGKQDLTLRHTSFVQILRKQLTLIGSWNSDFSKLSDDWGESIRAIAEGRIDPLPLITHKIPLAEADRAFQVAGDKNEFYNKIMVVMEK